MNKLFTKIAGLSLGLAMAIGVGVAVGSKDAAKVDATDTNVSFTTGSNTVAIKVNWNSAGAPSSNNGVRMGTSGSEGSATFSIPSGTTKFGFYAVGWKGKATTASVSASVGTITSSTASLTSNNAATGTISANATVAITETEANAKKEFTISGVTSASTITLTTSGSNKRLIAWDAYYVSASKTLSGIVVKTAPTKTTYYAGDYFDPTGLELTATYSDSSTETISYASHSSDFSFTPSTSTALTQSNTSVTITYGGKSTTQAITVNPARTLSSISVSTAPTQTTYSEGQYFDPTGLVITRTFSDSSSDTYTYANHTSEFSFSPSTSTALTTSDKSVTITYGGKSTTQSITVNEVTKYELITDASGLVSGCNYLIGNASQTKFMSTTQNGNNRGVHTLSGTVTNNKVGFESGMEVVTLGGSSGAWTLYANNSETAGYLYLPSNNNYLRTRDSEFSWGISFNDGTPLISATATNERWIKYNGNNTIFSCYQSGQEDISLWKEVSTAESVSISKDSVSGFKGDLDTTVSITAVNFDPTNIEVSYSTSGVATVTKGTISNRIIPLNVAFNSAGTTTATITVKGGKADYSVDLGISVEAKPSILRVVESRTANPLVDITSIEIENGDSTGHSFSKLNIYVEDTDGNAIEIGTISDYVTLSRISGDDCVTISGGKITGKAVGTAVVKFELNSLTSVYDTIIVNVNNDSNKSVTSITYVENATVDQGEELAVSDIISASVTETHFGKVGTIADSEYLFAYTNNRASAVGVGEFVYEITDDTLNAGDYENRDIHVFVTFDEEYHSSTTIDIKVEDRPVTGLLFDGVAKADGADIAISIQRNSTYNLNEHVSVNPANATESHIINYTLKDGEDYVSLSNGVLTVGNLSGDTVACVSASPDVLPDFSINLWISITRETVTITYDAPESWTKVTDDSTLAAGDVIIVTSESKGKVMGEFTGSNKYANEGTATFESSTASNVSGALEYTLEAGSTSGTWKLKNGTSYLYGTNAKTTLCLSGTATDFTISISSGDATINSGGDCRILHNSGSTRFSNYTSSTSSTMLLPQIYKKSGGESTVTATSALLDVLDTNMDYTAGSYSVDMCDSSGASFNASKWATLGSAFTSDIKSANQLAYARASKTGNEVEQFLAAYDYVVAKYGEDYDFLERIASGKISTAIAINPLNAVSKSAGTTIAIIVITTVSLAAVGGYFLFRKKKEN